MTADLANDYLQVSDVEVHFGGVYALQGFDLTVGQGEIHGLIGPNGAGKTTAINVISGLQRPDAGMVRVGGAPMPARASEVVTVGLARTFQAPAMFHDLDVLDNVVVGGYASGKSGFFRSMFRVPSQTREERELRARAREKLEEVGYEFDFHADVSQLPFGALRKIELARALMSDPAIMLLDELTSGLAESEVAGVAALLRQLRDEASPPRTILVVEHNVPYIFGLCDVVTAMDKGRTIARGTSQEIRDTPAVIESYLGSAGKRAAREQVVANPASPAPIPASVARDATARAGEDRSPSGDAGGPPMLVLDSMFAGYGGTNVLNGTSLEIREGELVAIFGRNGAGKSTLMNAIMGNPKPSGGSITWQGHRVERWSTQRRVRRGIGLVPQGGAVLAEQTVDDNMLLASIGLGLSRSAYRERYDQIMERFPALRARHQSLGGSLSGGERQMLAIGKALMRRPQLLMLDEPSAGLAPSIVDQVQELVAALNEEGLAVLVAEQNVTWVEPIAHRAYLLETGSVVAQGSPSELASRGAIERQYLGEQASGNGSAGPPARAQDDVSSADST